MKKIILSFIMGVFLFACERRCFQIEDLNAEKTYTIEMNDPNVFQKQDCTHKPCVTEFVLSRTTERREIIGNLIISEQSCK